MGKKNKKEKKQKKDKKLKPEKNKSERTDKKIAKLEAGINKRRLKINKLQSHLAHKQIENYTLKDRDGNDVKLSDLFGDKKDMILIHNMGRNCSYCTMWADGFNGLVPHLQKRSSFILVSPDPPQVQREFAETRGWKFPMYSAMGSTLVKDLGFQSEQGDYWPGASILHRKSDNTVVRVNKTNFGPGDFFCSVWHFFDMMQKPEEAADTKDNKKSEALSEKDAGN